MVSTSLIGLIELKIVFSAILTSLFEILSKGMSNSLGCLWFKLWVMSRGIMPGGNFCQIAFCVCCYYLYAGVVLPLSR